MSILCSGYSRQCAEKKHINQDKIGCLRVSDNNKNEITLAVVADGISLGYQGKYASYNTVLWLLEWGKEYLLCHEFDVHAIAEEIQQQMVEYNHTLNDFSDKNSDKDTCCTVCGFITDEKQMLIFNAGDSRLYELTEDANVRCLTQDDKAEDGHSIAMHIGGKNDEEVNITFGVEEFHGKSRYILCSDGFYNRCNFQNLKPIFDKCGSRSDYTAVLEKITDSFVNAGEKDDISALILTRSE